MYKNTIITESAKPHYLFSFNNGSPCRNQSKYKKGHWRGASHMVRALVAGVAYVDGRLTLALLIKRYPTRSPLLRNQRTLPF